MNIKLPAMIDLDGRNINPAHIAFFLPARQQDTGEPDPSRTLVIPLQGKAYAVALMPEDAAARARFPYLAGDGVAFNPAAGFRVQSTDYNGAATRLSIWENDSVFQNLKTAAETVAEAHFGKGADLARLNRTILPKSQITAVLPYRDNEGRGFQAQAVLDNGRRVRTQEDVATVAKAHGFHYLDEGNVAVRPGADIEVTAFDKSTAGNLKSERDFNSRVAWGDRGPRNSVLVEAPRDVASRVLILGLPKGEGEPEPDEKIRRQARAGAAKRAAPKAEGGQPAPQG